HDWHVRLHRHDCHLLRPRHFHQDIRLLAHLGLLARPLGEVPRPARHHHGRRHHQRPQRPRHPAAASAADLVAAVAAEEEAPSDRHAVRRWRRHGV
ncbi:hypothetical protein BN1708_019523, partial [Verticillium longisporum]